MKNSSPSFEVPIVEEIDSIESCSFSSVFVNSRDDDLHMNK